MDKHTSTIAQLAALFLLLLVVVILALHGTKEDGTLLAQLVTGAVGIAGAIAGFSKHSDQPAPGTTTATVTSTSQPATGPERQTS